MRYGEYRAKNPAAIKSEDLIQINVNQTAFLFALRMANFTHSPQPASQFVAHNSAAHPAFRQA